MVPVKVSAGTVRLGAVALQAVVEPVPAAMLVAAQLPLVAVAAFVPCGVPALVPLVAWLDVPVNTGAVTVPAGVMVAFPPVVPTSPLAAIVPCTNWPFRAVTWVNELGQVPLRIIMMAPEGKGITPVGIRL